MLTLFTTAKPCEGHSGVIQRNALKSCKLLHPEIEIILFGDDAGGAEIAKELGFLTNRLWNATSLAPSDLIIFSVVHKVFVTGNDRLR
jgi:hypothetical protein